MDFAESLGKKLGGKSGAAMSPSADDAEETTKTSDYEGDPAELAAASNFQEATANGTPKEILEAFKNMMAVCG